MSQQKALEDLFTGIGELGGNEIRKTLANLDTCTIDKVHVPELKNAQELAQRYPDTFHAPAMDRLRRLYDGDLVKVSYGKERFWVLLKCVQFAGENLYGTVNNELIGEFGYNRGDIIHLRRENVYDVERARNRTVVMA